MIGNIRIRAKAVQPVAGPGEYPVLNGLLPTWCDVEICVVAADGSETPLTGVRSFKLEAAEGAAPLRVTMDCYVDEIDVLARVEPTDDADALAHAKALAESVGRR